MRKGGDGKGKVVSGHGHVYGERWGREGEDGHRATGSEMVHWVTMLGPHASV